jgi:hypothetical protein
MISAFGGTSSPTGWLSFQGRHVKTNALYLDASAGILQSDIEAITCALLSPEQQQVGIGGLKAHDTPLRLLCRPYGGTPSLKVGSSGCCKAKEARRVSRFRCLTCPPSSPWSLSTSADTCLPANTATTLLSAAHFFVYFKQHHLRPSTYFLFATEVFFLVHQESQM